MFTFVIKIHFNYANQIHLFISFMIFKQIKIKNHLSFLMVFLILIGQTTKHLDGKPKDNKFRQWWSNHICDLDNKY